GVVPVRCQHDMPFGAHLREGGGAAFRLWAPAAKQVELAIETASPSPTLHAASADTKGWWECVVPEAAAGTLYRWRTDGNLLVPDPASRHNPEGPHGPSELVAPPQFGWDESWTGRPRPDTARDELRVGSSAPE